MKTIIAITALVASVASASASVSTFEIERYVSAEQASVLTDAEVTLALNAIHGSSSEGEKRAFILSLVK